MEITQQVAEKVLATVDAGLCAGIGSPMPGKMCVEAAVCYAMGLPHSDEPTCVSSVLRTFKIGLNDCRWSSNEARAKGMRRLALIQLGTAGTLDEVEFAKRLATMTIKVVVPAALRAAASIRTEQAHKDALEAAAVHCEIEGTEAASDAASAASAAASDAASAASMASRAASAASDAASYAASAASMASRAASMASRAASRARYAASYVASDAASDAARAASMASRAASRARYAASYASDAASDALLSRVAEASVQILIELGAAGAKWLRLTE